MALVCVPKLGRDLRQGQRRMGEQHCGPPKSNNLREKFRRNADHIEKVALKLPTTFPIPVRQLGNPRCAAHRFNLSYGVINS
jgi:hypothetical protein